MKIYVAGPMTGLPEWNYPAFNAAAAELRAEGHEVVNPAEMGEKYGTANEINADPQKLADLIIEELDALAMCDAIYLLPGWEKSPGTRRELGVALAPCNRLQIIVAPVEDAGGVKRSIEVVVSKIATTTHGNAAAMRDTLLRLRWIANATFEKMRDGVDTVNLAQVIWHHCNIGLSAPLRNCDRVFADHSSMYDEFKSWCNKNGHTMEPKLAYDAFDWLLAIATEG